VLKAELENVSVNSCILDITRLLEVVETFLECPHHVRVARVFESYRLLHVNIGIDLFVKVCVLNVYLEQL
jgi:hypothetical protein